MGKKFSMKNLVSTMMALTVMNVGGSSAFASAASTKASNITLSGGEWTPLPSDKFSCVGITNARRLLRSILSKDLIGKSSKTIVSSDDPIKTMVERGVFFAILRGAAKDCLGVPSTGEDTRWFGSYREEDAEKVKFTLVKDENAFNATKDKVSDIFTDVRNCYDLVASLKNKEISDVRITKNTETYIAILKHLDANLQCLPSVTEASVRYVILRNFLTEDIKDSLLGKFADLGDISEKSREYSTNLYKKEFARWTTRWDDLVNALKTRRNLKIEEITGENMAKSKQRNNT